MLAVRSSLCVAVFYSYSAAFTALFVLVLALLFVLHRCAVAVPARDAAFNPHVTRELHRSFARRAVRALAVVLAFGFEVIWVYCVKAFSCASTPAVLVVDPFQVPRHNLSCSHRRRRVSRVHILLFLFLRFWLH